MDPRWKHPFTSIVAGPTMSGKTHFVLRFLKEIGNVMLPTPEEIMWCYGEWQDVFKHFPSQIKLIEGLPDDDDDDRDTNNNDVRKLVIIDDLMSETNHRVTRLFTKGSHHKNTSVIYIVQNLFSKNKEQRTISLNSHYLVLFKNPRDTSQITNLAKQMRPGNIKYIQDAFKDATSKPHGYLLVDLKQDTPEHLRLRTNIFPPGPEYVYLEK